MELMKHRPSTADHSARLRNPRHPLPVPAVSMNAHPSNARTRIAWCGLVLLLGLTLPALAACSDDDADLPVWEGPYSEEALEVFARCWNNTSEEACNAQEGVAIMVRGERMERCEWRTRASLRPSDTCWSDWSYCHIAIPDFECGQEELTLWLPDVDSGRFVYFRSLCYIGIPGMSYYSSGPEPEHIDMLPAWPDPFDTCPPDGE